MSPEDYARDQHARNAAMERLWSHTVGIANRALVTHGNDPHSGLPGREEESPGTGVAGAWGNHYFILTAKHMLEGAQVNDINLFGRPTASLRHASRVTIQDALVAVPLSDPGATVHRCDWEDLAVLMVNPGCLGPYLEFVDIASSWSDPSEGEYVIGLGYPVSSGIIFSRQVGELLQKAVLLNPVGFDGDVLPSSTGRYFSDFNPDHHYLFPYELATQGKHPRGISGAAMWLQSIQNHLVWAPRFKFAGICTSSYKDGTIEQVVKASVVCQFLTEVFGTANAARSPATPEPRG